MTDRDRDEKGMAVPRSRLGRMARMGGLATRVAGNVLTEGAQAWSRGERPSMSDLILTPQNAARVADQLSQLRGAAMKVGQMMSMEGSDILPPAFAELLERLRDNAHHMPPKQLRAVLDKNWGKGWLQKFERFDVKPIAAASIGQVHRGRTKDGRDVAIKIQYPGVRESIDSDVDNVASLIKISGLMPKGADIRPLLEEAKAQLHEEADYEREGAYLEKYQQALGENDAFAIPGLHRDLTTKNVLAMDLMSGVPVESLAEEGQDIRNHVVSQLMDLLIRELFEFRLMQTDPNFANYRYDRESERIVLLDFGATRDIPDHLSEAYRQLTIANINGDKKTIRELIIDVGFLTEEAYGDYEDVLLDILHMVSEPYRMEGAYDFGASDLALRLRDRGMEFRNEDKFSHLPPKDVLFIHRKIGGIYLLARRLKAQVDVASMTRKWL